MVVLLTPGALDRCKLAHSDHETDWVRREIARALTLGKNIVPVHEHGFTFPKEEELPPDIRDLLSHNCVEWSHTYQDASFSRLERFLKRSPETCADQPESALAFNRGVSAPSLNSSLSSSSAASMSAWSSS